MGKDFESGPWPISRMKIILPYQSNDRIREALGLWPNQETIVLGLPQRIPPDRFSSQYPIIFFARDARQIGDKQDKLFVGDMLQALIERFPNEDYYGIGNSDILFLGDSPQTPAIIYHRANVLSYKSEKKDIFYPGEDLFLMKIAVIQACLKALSYYIIGAPAWDTVLAWWLRAKYPTTPRIYNKVLHKIHFLNYTEDLPASNWNRDLQSRQDAWINNEFNVKSNNPIDSQHVFLIKQFMNELQEGKILHYA